MTTAAPIRFFHQPANKEFGALEIGLTSLGCMDDDGEIVCESYKNGRCTSSKAGKCTAVAMRDYAETQAEIVLASIAVLARRSASVADLRASLSKVETAIDAALSA